MQQKRERGDGFLRRITGCDNWFAVYRVNGCKKTVSTGTHDRKEAEGKLRDLIYERDHQIESPAGLKQIRYEDLRRGLIANYIEKGNKSLQVTADGEEDIWGLKALDKFYKGYRLLNINTDSARTFAKKRLAQGKANDTINGSLALLRRMLYIAKEDGKIVNVPKIRLLKAGNPRQGFVNLADFEKILAELPENLRPLIIFLYYSGTRLGEALQVQWPQWHKKLWQNKWRSYIELEREQTKNAAPRIAPLPDRLTAILDEVKDKTGPIFDGTNLRKAWHKACVAAGVGKLTKVAGKQDPQYTGLTIHDLRRSAVNNLRKMKVSETLSMRITGHKTRAVFDRYNICETDELIDAMQQVENGESSVKVDPKPEARPLLT